MKFKMHKIFILKTTKINMLSPSTNSRLEEIFPPDKLPVVKKIINYFDEKSFHSRRPRGYKDIAKSDLERDLVTYGGINKNDFENVMSQLFVEGYIHEKRGERYSLAKSLRRKIN
jgi:hypothetical protein